MAGSWPRFEVGYQSRQGSANLIIALKWATESQHYDSLLKLALQTRELFMQERRKHQIDAGDISTSYRKSLTNASQSDVI
jgi:hypothetical protein